MFFVTRRPLSVRSSTHLVGSDATTRCEKGHRGPARFQGEAPWAPWPHPDTSDAGRAWASQVRVSAAFALGAGILDQSRPPRLPVAGCVSPSPRSRPWRQARHSPEACGLSECSPRVCSRAGRLAVRRVPARRAAGSANGTGRLLAVPPEIWNRLGTKVLPKLRSGDDLSVGIEFSVGVGSASAKNMETELQQILNDLGLGDRVRLERS